VYSSALTASSQIYSKTGCDLSNYYYEAMQVKVIHTGSYSFSSNSTFDTHGYIYNNNFDPFNPDRNLYAQSGNRCPNGQFGIITYLQMNTIYILIVTTSSPDMTGPFSIFVSGPNNVILNRMGEYLYYLAKQ